MIVDAQKYRESERRQSEWFPSHDSVRFRGKDVEIL
jgi:hypothetical protein